MLSRRLSSAAGLARIVLMTRNASINLLERVPRTRLCLPVHPPLTVQKAMAANRLEVTLVYLTTSLSEITSTPKMSWKEVIRNILNTIRRQTTIASPRKRSSPRLLTLPLHSAIILNRTVVPSLSIFHRIRLLQRRAFTATIRLQDSANLPLAQPRATITTIWRAVPSMARLYK